MRLASDYPYMYARVSAKRAKLLDRKDYEKLWKMEPNAIARNLEERDYQEDINELAAEYEGVDLIELALMRNLSRTMADLVEIAPESLKPVLETYLRRYDILSIKRLLRWKRGGEKNNIHSFLLPVGRYSFEDFEEMAEKSFEEICESISFPESDRDYSSCCNAEKDLREIERELDRCYYRDIRDKADDIGSMWFDKFIDQEMEYENLKIALRLKKYGIEADEIEEWLVTDSVTNTVEEIMNAEDFQEAIQVLRDSGKAEDIESDDIEDVEYSLEVARLRRALRNLHIEPLGATSILGYILAKTIEVKNLRMLVRAKETGIQNIETIKRNLVIA